MVRRDQDGGHRSEKSGPKIPVFSPESFRSGDLPEAPSLPSPGDRTPGIRGEGGRVALVSQHLVLLFQTSDEKERTGFVRGDYCHA